MNYLSDSIRKKIFEDYNNKAYHIVTTKSGKRKKRNSVSAIAQHYGVSISTCYSIIHEFKDKGNEVTWRKPKYQTIDDTLEEENLEDSSLIETVTIKKEDVEESLKYPEHEPSVVPEPEEEKPQEEHIDTVTMDRKKVGPMDDLREQYKHGWEKEKYNNQSIVLYKCIDYLSEEDRVYIKEKVNIDDETLDRTLKTYNKDTFDFSLENKIADCILEKDIASFVEPSIDHYDEKKSNQAVILHKCKEYLDSATIEYIKGLIRATGIDSNVDVEEKFEEMFSSEYRNNTNFSLENQVSKYLYEHLPQFKGSDSTAHLAYEDRDQAENIFDEVYKLQHSETEVMDEDDLPIGERVVLKPAKKNAMESQTNMPVVAKKTNPDSVNSRVTVKVKSFEKENDLPTVISKVEVPYQGKRPRDKINLKPLQPEDEVTLENFKETDSDLVEKHTKERTDKFQKMMGKEKSDFVREFGMKNLEHKKSLTEKGWKLASIIGLGSAFLNYMIN